MKTLIRSALVLLLAAPALRAADGALDFVPGSQQRVEVSNFAGLGISTEVTVEFWVRSTSNSIAQSVFMLNPDVPTNRFQSHVNYFNGNTYWDFGDIGSGGRVQLPNEGSWLNNWTHFALTAKSGSGMKIYANGVQVASESTFNALESVGTAILSIGGIPGTYFQGKIDDFRIWSIARTPADIQRDFSRPLTGSETGLKLYLKFDEASGNTALNSATATAGTHPSGTLMGPPLPARVASDTPLTYVTTTADSGTGSLRQAVANAVALPGAQTITFDPALSGQTITLTSQIDITDAAALEVDASALPGGITISGNNNSRIFQFAGAGRLTLRRLTLTHGFGIGGANIISGGAVRSSGLFEAFDCTFAENSSDRFGGAISLLASSGTSVIERCTFNGNTNRTGGEQGAAAVFNSTTLLLRRCTFSGNSCPTGANNSASALRNDGTATIEHCTFAGNTGPGTGIVSAILAVTTTTISSTIVSDNPGGSDVHNAGSTGTVHYTGENVVPFSSGAVYTGTAPITLPALTGPPGSYGGPTQTRPLLAGSPARDAATSSSSTADQRGFAIFGARDIGAYESQLSPVTPASLTVSEDNGTISPAPGFSVGANAGALTVSSSNPALVASPSISGSGSSRTLSVTPLSNASGTAIITVSNPAGGDVTAFTLTVTPVNDPPSFTPGDDQTVLANSGPQTVSAWATAISPGPGESDELEFEVSTDNSSLFSAGPAINPANGALTYTPAENASGTATVTVTLKETASGGLTSQEANFTITIENQITNANDSGPGSLRSALATAASNPGPDTLTFPPALSGGTITLTGPDDGTAIVINDTSDVTLDATNLPGGLTIQRDSGNVNYFRLFSVASGTSLTLRGLTLANGGGSSFPAAGGAIENFGTLTLTQCTLSGNFTFAGGGAIYNAGTLTLTHCTLSGNSGGGGGGGGGAISNSGTLTLTHCTLSGNSTTIGSDGGAIENNSTLTLTNSIVAGNMATGNGADIYQVATNRTVTANGANIVQTAIFGGTVSGTIANVDPLLAPLADNGGPTKTMALLPGSPALDAAVGSTSTTDQRGLPRSRDGDGNATATPDIGAYEAQVAPTGALGFNFNGASPRNLAPTDLAGAPGFAQTHWNNLTGDFAFSNGSRTLSGGGSATVRTWYDAPNVWQFGASPVTADEKLMRGYLDSNGVANDAPASDLYAAKNQPFFALADLPSAFTLGGYRVVVYADTDATANRVGEYWLTTHSGDPGNVTGTTDLSPHLFLADNANFSGTYTRVPATSTDRNAAEAGNYLVFENQTQPAFILRTEDHPSFRAVINAVQVVRNEILVVTTAEDENDPVGTPGNGLSLREAVALAPDGAGIVFDSALSGQTITLGSEILLTQKNVTIDASNLPAGVTIDGGPGDNRIFSTDKTVTLKNLTLTGGGGTGLYGSGTGGAIYSNGGRLTLERCTLSGNSANSSGGAIGSSGTLTLMHCTLVSNSANEGGAIFNNGTLTLTHCTLSGNSAIYDGGAIYDFLSTLTLTNCIVAGNTITVLGRGPDIYNDVGTIPPTGVNLIGNLSDSGLTAGPNVIVSTTPGLAPLGNYGGPTQTMPPLPGSPAIDAAAGSTATTDQRGFARPQDGDGNGTALADIGAVERSAPPVVTATADSGPGSLRQAIAGAAIEPGMETITFAPGFTASIMLGSEIVIGSDVHINAGSIASGVTINGGTGTNRIFTVNSGTTVTLQNLALTGGNGSGGGGGAILNNGTLSLTQCLLFGNSGTFAGAIENNSTLTLTDCALTGNTATSFGAGAIDNSSSLTLLRCTFSGNTGNTFGGAIHHNTAGSTLSLTHCTFSGNTATNNGGGAIFMNAGTATLTHCTLAGNTASSGDGGGAIRQSGGTLTLTHSIVAANTAGTNADIRRTAGTTNATGANLIGNLSGSNLTAGTTVLVGAPLLAPLGNYGGPTQTMALLPNSPARDAATVLVPAITSDQRGYPIIGTPDIGAYEAGTLAPNYNAYIYETLPAAATPAERASTFDYDGDGQTNEFEWLGGTSATDPASMFLATPGGWSGGNLLLSYPTIAGRNYTTEFSPDLTAWSPLPSFTNRPGTGAPFHVTVSGLAGFPRFYLRVIPSLP